MLIPIALMVSYLACGTYIYSFATTFTCALIAGWYGIHSKRWLDGIFIVGAFLFSIAGDRMLSLCGGHDTYFVYGIILFFIAHLFYIFYCLQNGRLFKPLLFILGAAYLIYYAIALVPAIGDKVVSIFVLLYTLVSCISMSAAFGLRTNRLSKMLFAGGITCLIFSDTLISIHSFLHISTGYSLMLPTYYASQILVTASFIHSYEEKIRDRKAQEQQDLQNSK